MDRDELARFEEGDARFLLEAIKREWRRLYDDVKPVYRVRWILPLLRKVWKTDEKERRKLLEMWFESYVLIESVEERFQVLTRFLRFLYEVAGKEGFKEESYEVPEV